MGAARMGLAAGGREDPIGCVLLLAQYRTTAGCSGPIAESSRAAWEEGHHKAQEGPRE